MTGLGVRAMRGNGHHRQQDADHADENADLARERIRCVFRLDFNFSHEIELSSWQWRAI